MDTSLSAAEKSLLDSYHDFASQNIAPLVSEIEPASCNKRLLEASGPYMGLAVPGEYGGPAQPFVSLVLFTIAVSHYSPGLGISLAAHNAVIELLKAYGSPEQKSRFLPALAKGKIIGALAFGEEASGTDIEAAAACFEPAPGGAYKLSGKKTWVTSGRTAGLFVVSARKPSSSGQLALLLAEKSNAVKIAPNEKTLGLREAGIADVEFDGVRLAAGSELESPRAQGASVTELTNNSPVLFALDISKTLIAAAALGLSEGVLEDAVQHAKTRKQFAKNIGEFQAIQWKLADMEADKEGTALQVYRAGWSKDEDPQEFRKNAAMAKWISTRTALRASSEALKILGAHGLKSDCRAARFYQDAAALESAGGTSEFQKLLLVPELRVLSAALIGFLACLCLLLTGLPATAGSAYHRGVVLYAQHKYKDAARVFTDLVHLSPNNADACYYAGLSYHQLGDMKTAKYMYRRAASFTGTAAAGMAGSALSGLASAGRSSQSPQASLRAGACADTIGPDYTKIYFTREGNELLLDAEITGRHTQVCFDTGASACAIGKNQLQQLGISPPGGPPVGAASVVGSGSGIPFWLMSATIKVGQITRMHCPLMVQEHLGTPPLLGQTFFGDYVYSIDNGANCITLHRKGAYSAASSAPSDQYIVPFRKEGSDIVIMAQVDGRDFPMYFDTGASDIVFTKDQLRALNITVPEDAQIGSVGGAGGTTMCRSFPISRIKLGPIDRSQITVAVVEDARIAHPLLGQTFYGEGWEYQIDNPNSRIIFTRR